MEGFAVTLLLEIVCWVAGFDFDFGVSDFWVCLFSGVCGMYFWVLFD